jgi:hypothetical protein
MYHTSSDGGNDAVAARDCSVYLVVVGNDGSFEVWMPNNDGSFCLFPLSSGRWQGMTAPTPVRLRTIVVIREEKSWYSEKLYAAEAAAAEAGRPDLVEMVNQRFDGRYICPHCGRKYKSPENFSSHLGDVHRDGGAANVVWGSAMLERHAGVDHL